MKITRKIISIAMTVLLVFGACVCGLPGIMQTAFALGSQKSAATRSSDLTFVVPEAIYLTPDARSWSTSTASTFQYYVNNNSDGSVLAEVAQTTGKIYFNLNGASSGTLSYAFLDKSFNSLGGGSVTLSSSTVNNNSYVNITGGTSPSLAATATGCYLRWALSFTENGIAKKAYAYSYIYKPYTIPIAAGALAGSGATGANWAGTLTWLSGMHGINVDAMPDYSHSSSLDSYEENNYLKFTEFASFTSKSNTARVGGTNVTSTTQGVASSSWSGHDTSKPGDNRYVSYANTSGTPKSYAYVLKENNRSPSSYNNGSADTNQNWGVKNTTFAKYRGNNKDIVVKAVAKSTGDISVDVSRYTNLNQIPNLAVGLAVTSDENCDDGTGHWWMADMSTTEFSHRSTWYKTDEDGLRPTAMERDYIFAGQGNDWHTHSYDTNEGIRYAGAWNKAIVNVGGSSQYYYIKSCYGNADGSYDANACGYIGLYVHCYDKSVLRAAVRQAIAKMPALGVNGISGNNITSCYFEADNNYKWNTFQAAFNAACKELVKVDGAPASDPGTLASNLYNAMNALCTHYEFNANGGSLSMPQEGYVTVGTNQYATVTPNTTATRTGYSFKGWSTNPNATPSQATTSNVQVGYNDTVYAIWQPNTYFISFITNSDESIIPNQYVEVGGAITVPDDPVKTGYTFIGWNPSIPSVMPPNNTSVTAQWQVNQYTISFDSAGGTSVAPITQDYGSAVSAPASPTRTGYTFAGWNPALPDTMPAYNATHTALWNVNIHSITYDSAGGSAVAAGYYAYDSAFLEPVPTRTGYNFTGWTYKDASQNPYTGTTMPDFDLYAVANWSIASFTITYNSMGGTEISPRTFNYDETITLPANPTKTGHDFGGWVYTDASDNIYTGTKMPAYNLTATAQWTAHVHTITLVDSIDNSVIGTITQDYGTAVSAPASPTREGKYFTYWSPSIPSTMPDEDLIVTANWSTETYNLIFNEPGYTPASQSVTYGEAYPSFADPVKEGHTFGGWFTDSGCTAGHEISFSGNVPDLGNNNQNINIYAKWTVNQYTIIFDTDGGTQIAPITQNYGTAVAGPADPEKDGCDFLGWDRAVPSTMPAENITITALWEPLPFTIYYFSNESLIESQEYLYGETVTPISDPEEEGYTFAGWNYINYETYQQVAQPVTMPAYDILAEAQWNVNYYTITFDTAGGSVINPIYQAYDTAITSPANPTREGYTFAGWDTQIPAFMPAENMTITAQWSINQYTITFNTAGGSAINPITADYGSAVTAPANPTREGYTFAGWDAAIPSTMPAQNLTITALWSINQYTITFDTAGGSAIDPITADYGSAVTAPANPAREGYTFSGWSRAIPATMPAENITITAQWQINQYTITFNTAGGTEIDPITLDYAAPVTPPANPTKEGYEFTGWDAEIPATMPAHNLTITALWNVLPFTITFDTAGGSSIDPITQNYGTVVVTPANPTREGYTFTGWDIAVPTTMPAQNMTITAQWRVNSYTITFNTDGGSPIEQITQDYGTVITAPSDPVKEGYTFTGWDIAVPATMPAQNMIITAQWSINQYTITFVTPDDATPVAAITGNYGDAVTAPADPARPGYTFTGWDTGIPSTIPAQNLTITSTWSIHTYHIVYDMQGGAPNQPSAYADYGTALTLPQSGFSKTGYTFTGWEYNGVTYTDSFTIPALPESGADITLVAQWSIGTFTLTFDTAGGNDIPSVTAEFASAINAPADPVRPGYEFTGWIPAVPATMPGENMTVTATWNKLSYRVAFLEPDSINGDATFANEAVFDNYEFYVGYGDPLTSIPDDSPAVNYFTFLYWSDTPGGAEVNLENWTMPAAAKDTVVYFYPVYERVEVEIEVDNTVSDAEIVASDSPSQIDGFIYNAGTKITKAALEQQFDVSGDGRVSITPSKGTKICGTGTKIELIDNYDDSVKATYYLIVPGDVNGDSLCTANDASMVEQARLDSDSWYPKDRPGDSAEKIAENAIMRECARLAADVCDQYNLVDDNDSALIQYHVLSGNRFTYDPQAKKYQLEIV